MTPYPKRLIEVDLPIRRISAHARREKSIRHGHISTLHIWWARRPLAACRAVICAALWPDPADELCPQPFRDAVARLLPAFAEQVRRSDKLGNLCSTESRQRWMRTTEGSWRADHPGSWYDMRAALLDFIADFANWDASTVPAYLETARGLTQASHEALGGEPGTRPLVVDPFAGGGAIPLEALRVGADAFASDLNPVAVLLNKVVLEYIPKYGNAPLRMMNAEGEEVVFQGLAEAVRYWGQWIKEQAERELAEFYPKDPDGATPIAYLWARTIRCEGPGCGVELPLIRSLWLSKAKSNNYALTIVPTPSKRHISIDVLPHPKSSDIGEATVKRGSVTCPSCGYTTPVVAVRRQLKKRRGGAASARMFAVVTIHPERKRRGYRKATPEDLLSERAARRALSKLVNTWSIQEISLLPDESTREYHAFVNRGPVYGLRTWSDYFTPRQLLAQVTMVGLVQKVARITRHTTAPEVSRALQLCLAFAVDRLADKNAAHTVWNNVGEKIEHVFGRQAIPMTWDFPEVNIFSDATGNWMSHIDLVAKCLEVDYSSLAEAHTELASATDHPLPDDLADVFFTDPPYYYSVQYADLSDFFYVWLRRSLLGEFPNLLGSPATPKDDEIIVQSPSHVSAPNGKNSHFYESRMRAAMAEGRRILNSDGTGVVVFAHKTTSGWEALLQSMIEAGWIITGSWPIDTERPGRIIAKGRAVLASSIHLVCRPRENPDRSVQGNLVGDWREVLQELPARIHAWLPRLAREGIVGADAIFACLGPALEIFSRYGRVEKASGEVMTLSTYLEYVWAAVSKEALDMVFQGADTSGFEEDARLTAMWLWTLSADGDGDGAQKKSNFSEKLDFSAPAAAKVVASAGYTLEFDAARKIAQGLGAHLEQLGHLVEVKGSNARLLPAVERTRFLFGVESAKQPARRGKRETQMSLFEAMGKEEAEAAGWTMDEDLAISPGRTVLDRVHQSMLLFAAGRSNALKRYLVDEGIGKDERFWSLAQALSALYPSHTDEKRWVDGVLARKKGLGF